MAIGLVPSDKGLVPGSKGVFFAMSAVQAALEERGLGATRERIRQVLMCEGVFAANGPHVPGTAADQPLDTCIFEDTQRIGGEEASGHVRKKFCQVPPVDILVVSASCKDFCRANSHVDRLKPVLAEASSRGGSAQTFNGFVSSCEARMR